MASADPFPAGHKSSPLERALKRERAARAQAELLLETKSRELYKANAALTAEHDRVQRKNAEIEAAHSALKETQGKLVQSEKLASVGQLAAGVAHEINNPIGFIMSNLGTLEAYTKVMSRLISGYRKHADGDLDPSAQAQLIADLRQLEEQEDIEFILEDIEGLLTDSIDGTKRVKDIVQGLKSFSRVDDAEVSEQDLHEGIDSTLKVVANEIKYSCEVIRAYGEIPRVPCNLAQVNQVFMNLLVNAAQAMDTPGTITITTKVDGDFVVAEFRDTGSGIPPETLGSIFDPFFTTKPVGSGTGLGLSISYGIIQDHGGTIDVSSEVGVGTAFSVRLPLSVPSNGEK
ncbi:MAG: ATP-binding protein [Gammaproteobacteria bacterium]